MCVCVCVRTFLCCNNDSAQSHWLVGLRGEGSFTRALQSCTTRKQDVVSQVITLHNNDSNKCTLILSQEYLQHHTRTVLCSGVNRINRSNVRLSTGPAEVTHSITQDNNASFNYSYAPHVMVPYIQRHAHYQYTGPGSYSITLAPLPAPAYQEKHP